MACGGIPYEENFCCSICLDVFTKPVTLPCGHNFCKTCIAQHWSVSQTYQCALCKERFPQNTELRVNTVLAEMSQQMKTSTKEQTREERGERESGGEVWCDVCERRAEKSCLICLTSFCGLHLAPHYKSPGLRRHLLMEPVKDLEKRMCQKHNRPLRFFCQSDQTCICQFCSESEHSRHTVVSMETEAADKRRELSKLQDELCQMTAERRRTMERLRRAACEGEDKAAEHTRDCVQAVFRVARSLETGLSQLIETMQRKQAEVERQTDFYVSQLEDEICELVSAKAELEENKNSNDNFQLVQNFQSLRILPRTLDLSQVEVRAFQGDVVDDVVRKMDETFADLDKFWTVIELKRARQFTVDAALDAKTIYPLLNLSNDGQRFEYGGMEVPIANNQDMFSKNVEVLEQQSMFFGSFYFEVTVGDTELWTLGGVRQKVYKKFGQILRPENGYWVIAFNDDALASYRALTASGSVELSPNTKPQKMGVLVDYEACSVSFYNSETAERIHKFEKCKFEGRVLPFSELLPSQKSKEKKKKKVNKY